MKVIDMFTQGDFHGVIPEVVGMVDQVHCSRRRLLQRGLEFHVYTINKSAHMKKTGNLFNDARICMFSACCFRQRTYMAQGHVNGVLKETWTHSCSQFLYIYIYI